MQRPPVPEKIKQEILERFYQELSNQICDKGPGAFFTSHESLGVIAEEYNETQEAVRSNNSDHIIAEMVQLMVSAYWGAVSESINWNTKHGISD